MFVSRSSPLSLATLPFTSFAAGFVSESASHPAPDPIEQDNRHAGPGEHFGEFDDLPFHGRLRPDFEWLETRGNCAPSRPPRGGNQRGSLSINLGNGAVTGEGHVADHGAGHAAASCEASGRYVAMKRRTLASVSGQIRLGGSASRLLTNDLSFIAFSPNCQIDKP
jgi:hypothetical protein